MATTSPETDNVTTPPAASPQEQGRAAFFYGTLMAPAVLHRVCHGPLPWNPSNPHYSTHNFKTYPAILPNHIRKRVVFADYPGVIPSDGESVRGVYVTGLTASDISRLDTFEGDEYTRQKVSIRLLQEEGGEKKNSSGEGGNLKVSVLSSSMSKSTKTQPPKSFFDPINSPRLFVLTNTFLSFIPNPPRPKQEKKKKKKNTSSPAKPTSGHPTPPASKIGNGILQNSCARNSTSG